MKVFILVFFLSGLSGLCARATTAYVANLGTSEIYQLDLRTGNASLVLSIPSSNFSGIALKNPRTAYVVGQSSEAVYLLDLVNHNYSVLNPSPVIGAALNNIALPSESRAYTLGWGNDTLYQVNLDNGNIRPALPGSVAYAGFDGLGLEMSVEVSQVAYVVGQSNNLVYKIDVAQGTTSLVTPAPVAVGLSSAIGLANNNLAYVGGDDGHIYQLNLSTGQLSVIPGPVIPGLISTGISAIALATSDTAYVINQDTGAVYFFNLITGAFSPVFTMSGLNSMALVLDIGTEGLRGNNLKFANYLNQNAPFLTLPLLALAPDVSAALQSAIPTRNACFTFAAQTTQIAFGQLVYDHLALKRRSSALHKASARSHSEVRPWGASSEKNLLTDASESIVSSPHPYNIPHSFWLSGLAEYSREKTQSQTPGFETVTGGGIIGFDFEKEEARLEPLVGGGLAYAYTRLHEKEGAGFANVNQGAVVLYAAINRFPWYLNLGFWGGAYYVQNVRYLNLSTVSAKATGHTNGAQFTPHFEFGYEYARGRFSVEPFEMCDWVADWEQSFKEHGAGKLNMGQKGRFCSLLRNEAGIRFFETLSYEWGTVTLKEKGSYVYQKMFRTGIISAFLVGSPGFFTVSTLTSAQNLGIFEFEALFVPRSPRYPYGSLSYQGEFGSKYQAHKGSISLGIDF